MKKLLFLLAIGAVVFSACTHTEKRVVPGTEYWEDPDYFVLKTKDNKTLWGLQTTIYLQEDKKTDKMILECEWDEIKTYEVNGEKFLLAKKNSLWHLFSSMGKTLFEGKGFSSIDYIGANVPFMGPATEQYYIKSPEGVYGAFISVGATYFGPYEVYWGGVRGYFFKENGKWGFKLAEVGATYDRKGESTVLIDAKYDALIEVYDHMKTGSKSVFIAKDGNKWIALNSDGKPVKSSAQRLVNLYKKTASRNTMSLRSAVGVDATTFKNNTEEAGVLYTHPIPWR